MHGKVLKTIGTHPNVKDTYDQNATMKNLYAFEGLQNLHFDTLTLSLTWANWAEGWSKVQESSFIGPTMWISSARDGKT